METKLAAAFLNTSDGAVGEAILRSCVHCGFCNATCPTYQLLGDELDGPRGRIYQMKQVLEGAAPTRKTLLHLDRCLTCRNCETTCPSGVEYGHLVDIGRAAVEERVSRPLHQRAVRWLLREGLTRDWLFGPAFRLGRAVSFALPASLRSKLGKPRSAGAWPHRAQKRRILLLKGCTQPAMSPSIDAATARVLDALGVQSLVERSSGCCGAIRHHLNDQHGALNEMRRNIDAWWPHIESGEVEAIVINASGCGALIKDYAHLLRDDVHYAEKAKRIVDKVRDLAEFLPTELNKLDLLNLRSRSGGATPTVRRVAFHPPCTLQHGLKIRGEVEKLLISLGAELAPIADSHLCCGSAGTYSLLQPELSKSLRDRKLENILRGRPEMILSANIGCLSHLESGTDVPVRHWIEWVDDELGVSLQEAATSPSAFTNRSRSDFKV